MPSSDTPIVVMEPTEYGDRVDAAVCLERPSNRLLVPEGLVRTRFVVEADVLGDDAPEVILTEDEDVVEHLSPECADEALSKGIHVRRAYSRAHDAHARRPEYGGEARAELRVVVADDNLRYAIHGGVSGLLRAPLVGRCIRHRGMGGSFGCAGPGRRARTARGTGCRRSARSHTPTSHGFAGTSTSSARHLAVESGACTAESFAYRRGCLA